MKEELTGVKGGGQPSDTGSLTFEDPNGGEVTVRVEECVRRKLGFVHIVRVSEGEDGEGLLERLDGEDAGGREVQPRVDWERRMDQVCLSCSCSVLLTGRFCSFPRIYPLGIIESLRGNVFSFSSFSSSRSLRVHTTRSRTFPPATWDLALRLHFGPCDAIFRQRQRLTRVHINIILHSLSP